jgi:Ca2+-binding RTX toxin-like protein
MAVLTGTQTQDTIYAWDDYAPDQIYGLGGNDQIYGGSSDGLAAYIDGGSGNDNIVGSHVADTIFGGDGADTVIAGSGNDTIDAGDGDDNLHANDGHDLVYCGAGNDTVSGWWGNDTVYGDDGNDSLLGDGANDLIVAGAGSDYAYGGTGDDIIYDGNNYAPAVANTNTTADTLIGGEGNDTLYSGGGHDKLYGGDGADTVRIFSDASAQTGVQPKVYLGSSAAPTVGGDGSTDTLSITYGDYDFQSTPANPGHVWTEGFSLSEDKIDLNVTKWVNGQLMAVSASELFAEFDSNSNGVLDDADNAISTGWSAGMNDYLTTIDLDLAAADAGWTTAGWCHIHFDVVGLTEANFI